MHSVIVSTVLLAADGGVQDEPSNIEFAPLPSSPLPHTCTHCSPYPRNHIRPPVPQSFIMFYSGNPFESRITEKRSLLQTILHLGPFWIQCSPKSPLDCLHLLLCFVLRSCMTVCTIIIIYCIITTYEICTYIYIYVHCLMTCLHMLLLLHDTRTPDYA